MNPVSPAVAPTGSGRVDALYVAGHGPGPGYGLHRFTLGDSGWEGSLLATVAALSALARHPSLPVVYGVSGDAEGTVHAWDVSEGSARALTELPSLGREPCHVAVDPGGKVLIVTNYSSSTLAVWRLAPDGSLIGTGEVVALTGHGPDADRQGVAHPHQAVFNGDDLHVADLGADVIRTFAVDRRDVAVRDTAAPALVAVHESVVPPGTGPRHMAVLPSGEMAVSGELASTVLVGRVAGETAWRETASTRRQAGTGPRNYPGDIRSSPDGRFVYVANRGYDTISTVRVDAAGASLIEPSLIEPSLIEPSLVDEFDVGARWPQHLLVTRDDLLVAARESSVVVALALADGVPSAQRALFDCPGAAWLELA